MSIDSENQRFTMEGAEPILALANALSSPFVLKSVIELGIPGILAKSADPLHYNKILDGSTYDSDIIRRLLQSLCRKNIFEENPSGFFGHNKLSRLLTNDHPKSVAPLIMLSTSKPTLDAWQNLREVALISSSSTSAFEKANGKNLYELAGSDPEFGKIFSSAIPNFSGIIMPIVMKYYGEGFKSLVDKVLVDVGGGNGFCISKIVQEHPQIMGINYDLPHAVANAAQFPGVKHVGGNMFEYIPSGDAIFMKTVLHNWNDEKCKVLLKNCYNALPENGKLIIVDMIFNPAEQDSTGFDSDIMMLLVTGGKERTQSEWEELLSSAGFANIAFNHLPMIKEGVVEAHKTSQA